MDLLDISKENIQPLSRGRNISSLSMALQAQTDAEVHQQLMKEREQFEILVRSYDGDDPLKPWYNYVLWVEQNFPKRGREGNLKVILENCLLEFRDAEQYSQDVRFIDLWTRYMSFADNPLEMYKQLHAKGIGDNCAIFYQCWAEEYEKANDMKRADQIFIEGIKRNAHPIEELMDAHTNFQVRVARNVLGQNPFMNQEHIGDERSALSTLRAHGRKKNQVTSTRVGNSVKHVTPGVLRSHSNVPLGERRNTNVQVSKYSVFNDENAPFVDAVAGMQIEASVALPQLSTNNKENTLKPGRWNEGKFKKKTPVSIIGMSGVPVTPRNPAYHVHEDEDSVVPRTPKTNIVASNILKVRRHIYEDEKNIPVALFEAHDPTKVAMYPKNKVYCGGTEFSLEELRAMRYWNRQKERKTSEANNAKFETEASNLPVSESQENEFIDGQIHTSGEVHSQALKDRGVASNGRVELSERGSDHQDLKPGIVASNILTVRPVFEDDESIPIALFESYDPAKLPMYPKNKVYSGGTEYSLEEIRAMRYWSHEEEKRRGTEVKKENKAGFEIDTSDFYETDPQENEYIERQDHLSEEFHSKVNSLKERDRSDERIEFSKEYNQKSCFEIYIEGEEDFNFTQKKQLQQQPLTCSEKNRKKSLLPSTQFLGDVPFSYFKVPKLLKVRKESELQQADEIFKSGPSFEQKECDQSLTVNTKAALNDVKSMWGSSPPPTPLETKPVREPFVVRPSVGCVKSSSFVTPLTTPANFTSFKFYTETSSIEAVPDHSINVHISRDGSAKSQQITSQIEEVGNSNFWKEKDEDGGNQKELRNSGPQRSLQSGKSSVSFLQNMMEDFRITAEEGIDTAQFQTNEQHSSHGNVTTSRDNFVFYARPSASRVDNDEMSNLSMGIPFVPSPGMTSEQLAALKDTEDKENLHFAEPKLPYCKSKKSILQPSKDVYFVPLEQQLAEEEEVTQGYPLSDETCCTEAFAIPLVSSTPMLHPALRTIDQRCDDEEEDNTIAMMNWYAKQKKEFENMPLDDIVSKPVEMCNDCCETDAPFCETDTTPGESVLTNQLSTIFE